MMAYLPILALLGLFIILALGIGVAMYLLRSFGLYGIAKRAGMPYAWCAFIPYVRGYVQGELAAPVRFFKLKIRHVGVWMLVLPVVVAIVMLLGYTALSTVIAFLEALSSPFYGMNYMDHMSVTVGILALIMVLLGILGSAAQYVLTGMVNYRIHCRYMEKDMALLHMMLGLFVPLYQDIHFFVLRNRAPLKDAEKPAAEVDDGIVISESDEEWAEPYPADDVFYVAPAEDAADENLPEPPAEDAADENLPEPPAEDTDGE